MLGFSLRDGYVRVPLHKSGSRERHSIIHARFSCFVERSIVQGSELLIDSMKVLVFSILVVLPLLAKGDNVDLSSKYPFQRTLFNEQGQYYGLYWNYSIAAGTIYFAVNVSTTGWVGFGISPNGQMPGSDVVIGWIATDGSMHFHVRMT